MTTFRALTVPLPMVDRHHRRFMTHWRYDPDDNPLAITVDGLSMAPVTFARTVLVAAFERAPRTVGEGVVRFWVPSTEAMRVALFTLGKVPAVFGTSTQAILAFGQATLAAVPVCQVGWCQHPACEECRWTYRQIPACSCGAWHC